MSSVDISVVIVTYNRHRLLKMLLEKLQQQVLVKSEIILADDGSSPPAIFEHLVDRYIWRKDDGFHKTELLNLASLLANSDNLLFIDDDCVPFSNYWLAAHVGILANHDVSIGSTEFFRIDEISGEVVEKYSHIAGIPGTYFTAVNVGIRREAFQAIGKFDPIFDGHYGHEDTDLGLRIKRNNLVVGYTSIHGRVGHFGKFYGVSENGLRDFSVSSRNFTLLQSRWDLS